MAQQHDPKTIRLFIIDSQPEFVRSLANRLSGMPQLRAVWSDARDVAEGLTHPDFAHTDLFLAGLPLPAPAGADRDQLTRSFADIPVVGFSDSGSMLFLHDHKTFLENVVITLPKTKLDNVLLEQGIRCALGHAELRRKLTAARTTLAKSRSDLTTHKRLERDLTAIKEAAEAANRAKSHFLANMSHEIRTPMNGILGMTELIMASDLTVKQRDYLEMIRQSASSLMDILNDVLDFSKIEAGKLELKEEPFARHPAIRGAISSFSALAQNKGLSLSCSIADNVPKRVLGDSGRLRQILVNLVGNAVKFTTGGSVQLTAECPPDGNGTGPAGKILQGRLFGPPDESETWTTLRLSVADTGTGIAADKLATIFESFTQADNSADRRVHGTGLGLAICKHLAQCMGGRIWAESEEGTGSLFVFEVKLRALADIPAETPRPAAFAPTPPLTILLAEDNLINQMFVTELLEQDGHRVIAVTNGAQALSTLAKHPVDVAFMDIQMPEMDGIQATRRIRAGGLTGVPQGLPIIAMTAHALKGDRERFLAAGMDGYLSKPVGSDAIHAALNQVLSEKNKCLLEDGAMSASKVLNEEWLLDAARGNRDFLKKLFAVFVEQQPKKIEEMRQAVRDANFKELTFLAHTFKGGAATMGATALKDRSSEVEQAAKACDGAKAKQEIEALSVDMEEAIRAMRKFMVS